MVGRFSATGGAETSSRRLRPVAASALFLLVLLGAAPGAVESTNAHVNLWCPGNPAIADAWEATWTLKGAANAWAAVGYGYTSSPRPGLEGHAGCITAFGQTGMGRVGMTFSAAGYLTFGGTALNSVVEMALPTTFGASGKVSLSAWVRTTVDADSVVFETGSGSGHVVTLKRGAGNGRFRFVVTRSGATRFAESSDNSFPLNTWVHVAVAAVGGC